MKKLVGIAATLSWIDKKAHIPVDDPDPGPSKKREDIIVGTNFRFGNLLEAFVLVDAQGRITKSGFTNDSGMYRGPSKFGFNSKVVGKIGRSQDVNASRAIFRQLVGARTVSHETAGALGGGGVGVGGGAVGGFLVGGPVGAFVGAIGVGLAGYFTGKEVAELVMSFPPIWSELQLVIYPNGKVESRLLSHSVFPSNTYYVLTSSFQDVPRGAVLKKSSVYDGNPKNLDRWQKNGWGPTQGARGCPTDGNPWGMANPAKTIGEKLTNETPIGY